MLELVQRLGEHCLVTVQGHGPLILTMFLAGLVGSLTHCAGMCGPLVTAQSLELAAMRGPAQGQAWRRLAGSALIPYQLGRTTTYMALGAIAALPIGAGTQLLPISWLPPTMLWIAAAMFLWLGLLKLQLIPAVLSSRLAAMRPALGGGNVLATAGFGAWRELRETTRFLMRQPTGFRGYLLGVLLGFLPCGLLYGALMVAAATGQPSVAAMAMLAFAAGTFPLSWAIGYGSRLATARFRAKSRTPLALLMIFNAVLLIGLSGALY